ncbi:MAG: non-ribosomal peptide synthetase [Blastocatellia bacterium AA13]|nr:MAG: non-ribosomal peptide synthetase [Blastocatellia bacterium AA13]
MSDAAVDSPIKPAVKPDGRAPLSFAQQRLWFIDQLEPGNPFYNVYSAVRVSGRLDIQALEKTFSEILRRHEVLRTSFAVGEYGEPVQVSNPAREFRLGAEDLAHLEETEREARLKSLAREEALTPFDLKSAPLLRVKLIRAAELEHVVLLTMHHIVSDGWSMGILIREVAALYEAFSTEGLSPLPELEIQYSDFAVWQREWLGAGALERQLSYWKQQLAGAPPLLELPTDRPRPAVQSHNGDIHSFALSTELTQRVKELCRKETTTLFMALMAAFKVLLSRYAGQTDISLGAPIANRNRIEIEPLIGFFVNTLVLRTRLEGDPTFRELLSGIRETTLKAYANQDVPFEKVVEELQPERTMSHTPLFQVNFVLQNVPVGTLELPGLRLSMLEIETGTAKFDLLLAAEDSDGRLKAGIVYNSDLFDRNTIQRMGEHFERLLESITADPDRRISQLRLLSKTEADRLVIEWNDTAAEYPSNECIHILFEKQALRAPERTAVEFNGVSLSYRDLDRRADQLAGYLQSLGVSTGDRVALVLEHSIDAVVAILGVLKAGAAYVPIDPDHPKVRMAHILSDAGVRVLLTQKNLAERLPSSESIHFVYPGEDGDELNQYRAPESSSAPTSDDLAYVIYTSGSTGIPKGVRIQHRALVNYVWWARRMYVDEGKTQDFALYSSLAFDLTVTSIFVPLISGNRIVVYRSDEKAVLLEEIMEDNRVQIVKVTPSHLKLIRERNNRDSRVERLIVGGEALETGLAREVHESFGGAVEIINEYGPTEATVGCMYYRFDPVSDVRAFIPIGRPAANARIYVFDEALSPTAENVAGEIYIAGAGLAEGYLNKDELTAERFVKNPFLPGELMYKTGDVGRMLSSGELEYLGRKDEQVKFHGYRIELNEIKIALNEHKDVRDCVVLLRKDQGGNQCLVAYYVSRQAIDDKDLRNWLSERIISETIPNIFVHLRKLPLTLNGKVNVDALPRIGDVREAGPRRYVAARTGVEEGLLAIWQEVLGIKSLGVQDNFFELGGHSLLATQVISRIRSVYGMDISLRELFQEPTVAGFARRIELALRAGAGIEAPPVRPVGRDQDIPLSYAQERLWFIDQLEPDNSFYNVWAAIRLMGELNLSALERSFNEIIRRHESLRTTFATVGNKPVQIVRESQSIALTIHDLSEMPEAMREESALDLIKSDIVKPFSLTEGPLLRVLLIRLAPETHIAEINMHHIVSDAWSLGVFIRELTALYEAYSADLPSPLPEIEIQYPDFAAWQRNWLDGEELGKQMSYWTDQLAGLPALLELPTDRPRPAIQTHAGSMHEFILSEELTAGVKRTARKGGATLFMTLTAAFNVLLSRYSGQREIAIGADVANRNRREIENLIGFFVNMLVIRTDLNGSPTFSELLSRVREVTLSAYGHQDVPFEKLVAAIQPERAMSHTPLFQVVFDLQNTPREPLKLPGLSFEWVDIRGCSAKFDVVLNMMEAGNQLGGAFIYNTDLFEAKTIERMGRRFERLLESVVENSECAIDELRMLTASERDEIVVDWNAAEAEFPRQKCIHELIEEQAEKTPKAVAVEYDGETISYAELQTLSDRIARKLEELGASNGERVGLYLEHSIWTAAAILGVLKSGSAYVPIDVNHPAKRREYIVGDAEIKVMLTESRHKETVSGVRTVAVDEEWSELRNGLHRTEERYQSKAQPSDVAYVIYTSGSTGEPKGVEIQHRALVNYVWWAAKMYVDEGTKQDFALYSSLAFDLTVTSIYTPLLTGNRIVVYRGRGAEVIQKILEDDRVEVLKLTPSHLRVIKERRNEGSRIKRLIVGGEALETKLAREVYESFGREVEIINEYGPTEATVGCMIYRYRAEEDKRAYVPIGRPAANMKIYVLDERQEAVAENVTGEIYISGEGLAKGYLNREELTDERFIEHAFVPGERMYRTGDLGRMLASGEVEYIGRSDEQIKYHGYRVEINEIRSKLNEHGEVRDSVVQVKRDEKGREFLVAYYAARQEIEDRELREWMRERVIEETIPNIFMHLRKLPLTINGKVNVEALPKIEGRGEGKLRKNERARTAVEEGLAAIWEDVLGAKSIGIHSNFFELGGHSLLATQVVSRVRSVFGLDMSLRALFEHPTLVEFAREVESAVLKGAGLQLPPLIRIAREGNLRLSFAQQRLWFIDQLEPGNPFYNVYAAVRVEGNLNKEVLGRTLSEIVRRHEVLRTVFVTTEGEPAQVILPPEPMDVPETHISGATVEEIDSEIVRLAGEEASRPFSLTTGPLLRVLLIRLKEEEQVVVLSMHHIVSDGWSMGVLVREVAVLYEAFSRGNESPLNELPIQYADFASWQRDWLDGEALETQLSFWREQLEGATSVTNLPLDRPRPPVQSSRGAVSLFQLSPDLSHDLKQLSHGETVTLFMTLLGALHVLLYHYTRQRDISVGTPIAGRNRSETEALIGFFVNTLVMRARVEPAMTFRQVLQQIREVALSAYAHQDVPFEKIVEELQPARSMSHSPLFQVIFMLQNSAVDVLEAPGLKLSPVRIDNYTSKFDLTLSMSEQGGLLGGGLVFNPDIFDEATATRMMSHFQTLLEGIVSKPDLQISELPLLRDPELAQLLFESNNAPMDTGDGPFLHQLFTSQARSTPDAIAVICEYEQISYLELNQRANQMGRYLMAMGVGPETTVGVCLERRCELIAALLGILKAGGAYLPLDPEYPVERLSFMLEDSHVAIIVTQESLSDSLPSVWIPMVDVDQERSEIDRCGRMELEVAQCADNAAYIIYTSGSTGQPKGVIVLHRGLSNYLRWAAPQYNVTAGSECPVNSPLGFDLTVTSMFTPLISGGRVVLRKGLSDLETLEQLFDRGEQYALIKATPSHLQVLRSLQKNKPESGGVGSLIIGGEALRYEDVEFWRSERPSTRLMNEYGPTETVVGCCVFEVRKEDGRAGAVPIGRAIKNSRMYLLGDNSAVTPPGAAGEIHIGGAGVARGYQRQPALTAEKFVPNPFGIEAGERVYRTGDLAKLRSDGNLEFIGRTDHQVKVRGYRIELGEIEAALMQNSAVREAVVIVRKDDTVERLAAYLVSDRNPAPGANELRGYLQGKLPEYMIPSVFVWLDQMPLTRNGKIDKLALPRPKEAGVQASDAYKTSATPIEEMLCVIWAELLDLEHVGVKDNFFELGGHSLVATQAVSRIRDAFRVEIALRTMFEYPTVEDLARVIEDGMRAAEGMTVPPIERVDRNRLLPLSFAQQRLWFIDQLEPGDPFYNMPAAVRLEGPLNVEVLTRSLTELLRRHDVLRTTFSMVDGDPVQVIAPPEPVNLVIEDLSGSPESTREEEALALLRVEWQRPFDLSAGPVVRPLLIKLSDLEHIVQLDMHHIVGDLWSLGVLIGEVAVLYEAFIEDQPSPLPELAIQYADYAVWQREWLQGSVLENQIGYWREQLNGAPAVLSLPTDRPRPEVQGSRGAVSYFQIPEPLSDEIRKLGRSESVTSFMTLLAAFQTLLYRYTGQRDIPVGTPIAGRNRRETEGLVGFFVNTLVMRGRIESGVTFRQFLRQVREAALGAYAHQDVPFEKLVEELLPDRSMSHTPLFQVMFALQNAPPAKLRVPELSLSALPIDTGTTKFDLTLTMSDRGGSIGGGFTYNADLFDAATITQMQNHFIRLLDSMAMDPDGNIDEFSMLSDEENALVDAAVEIDELDASFSI